MDSDYLAMRIFTDGMIGCVIPLTYNRARITLGYDLLTYEDSW
jgi:hypothetical protein